MKPTEKELLDTVKFFEMLFDMSSKVKPGNNGFGCVIGKPQWLKDQEETQQRIANTLNSKGIKVINHPDLINRPYTFELPLTFKEFDTYYTLTKDIVGLDKDLVNLKVQGLQATLQYLNPLDERRTKFNYTFELPEISDLESIYITYIDGCLTITIPKLARKIKHYTVQ